MTTLRKEMLKELEKALFFLRTCKDEDVNQHVRNHVFRITNHVDDSIDLVFKEACINQILPDIGLPNWDLNGDPQTTKEFRDCVEATERIITDAYYRT